MQTLPIAVVLVLFGGAVAAQLQLAQIGGIVVAPSGDLVAGADVVLLDPLGSRVARVTTAADGRFTFASVAPGEYVLHASAPQQAVKVALTIDRALPIETVLRLTPVVSEAVQIVASGEAPVISRVSLAGDSIQRIPTRTRTNALQNAVATAPGWATEDNGLLHVRGVDDGVLYVVDGVPVYERLDALSGIGPDMLTVASMNVITGYVPPEFGLKSAGVVDIRTATGPREWTGAVDAGFGSDTTWNSGGAAGGPLGTRAAIAISAAANGSDRFLDPVHPDNFHNTGSAGRADVQLTWAPGAADLLAITSGGGRSSYDVPHGDEQEEAGQDQRQDLSQGFATGSWQRTWSSTVVSQVAAFHRRTSAELHGSPRDVPLFAASDRSHARTGVLTSVTRQLGSHVFKTGAEFSGMRLDESFAFAITDEDEALEAGLSENALEFDDDDPFAFADTASPTLWSFYVQDSVRASSRVSLDLGVRFDRTTLLVPAQQWSPRLGFAFRADDATTLRASFSRFFQPPQPEHLLLSSSVAARELSPFTGEGAGGADVKPERQTAVEAGIERLLGGSARLSAAAWLRRVRDAGDPNVFFGTTIVFPNSVAQGRAHGLDLRFEMQPRHGVSAYASYGYARVVQTGPIDGGLFLEEEIGEIGPGVEFTPDHDQRHSAAAGATWAHARSGVWLSMTGRYETGTPVEFDDDDEAGELPGASMVDFERGRVKPRTVINLLAGVPLLRTAAAELSARVSLLNVFDARYAYNFSNPFSGTHFGAPRTAAASLTIQFR